MRIGVAADHGGYAMKEQIAQALRTAGHEVVDFGAYQLDEGDDYPDFVVPLARAIVRGEATRGIAICGSGVGACVVANKVNGARACLIEDAFSAHQGVEDDNMNIICLGARVMGFYLAWELIQVFIRAEFSGAERHKRRLAKVSAVEHQEKV